MQTNYGKLFLKSLTYTPILARNHDKTPLHTSEKKKK